MSEIDFRRLQDFFAADEIEWRLQQAGEKNGKVWAICIPYVTNRAIMQRLDDVCGPDNWRNEFTPGPGGGVLCGISIRVLRSFGDPQTEETTYEWVTKWDGAENTDIEEVKGGLSGAMKRAAVQLGVGRYLYRLDESFANVHEGGKLRGKTKDGKPFRWDPPRLPDWALPGQARAEGNGRSRGTHGGGSSTDRSGRAQGEHLAMLAYIKATRKALADGEVGVVDGLEVPLKVFITERAEDIKEQVTLARAVVEALEKATGSPFGREAA